MRRRWAITVLGAVVLLLAVRVALDDLNGSSPSTGSLISVPGAGGGSGDLQGERHCDRALTSGLRSASASLSVAQRRARPRTIAAVCGALPGGASLEVAAQEVLTIVRNRGG